MGQVNWLRPLVLAAFLFVVGTLAYWLEYSHRPKKEEQAEEAKKVFKLKETPISTVRIVDGDRQFAFKCAEADAKRCKAVDQSKWDVTEPAKLIADDSNVNSLLSSASSLNPQDTIDLSAETAEKKAALLKDYRLDVQTRKEPKTRRLEITPVEGASQVLYLGETHPIGDTIFALSGDDETKVYLLPGYFKDQFNHDLTHWRDKKLVVGLTASDIQKFELRGTKATLVSERKDGQWSLKPQGKSSEMGGDTENIDSFLREAQGLTAKKFISEEKSDAAAQKSLKALSPVLTVTLYPEPKTEVKPSLAPAPKDAKPPQPITLQFYEKKKAGKAEALYATVSDKAPLFELDVSIKDRLDKAVKDLRQTKLMTAMDRFGAKRLEFTGQPLGASPLALTQKDGKWLLASDNSEADVSKVQTLLEKLSASKIEEFLQSTAIPTGEKDGVRVSLFDEKNTPKRQWIFWKGKDKNKDKFYARDLLSKEKEAFLMEGAVRDALPWNRDFFNKLAPVAQATPSPKK